jgi:hypothetical protein
MVFARVWPPKPEGMLSSEEEPRAERAYQLVFLSKAERNKFFFLAFFRSQSDGFTSLVTTEPIALMESYQLF